MAKLFFLLPAFFLMFSTFAFAQNAQETEPLPQSRPNDTFYERTSFEKRAPLKLPHVREADILWSKRIWQNIDLNLLPNQPLYYPVEPTGNFSSLMTVLSDALLAGEIRAYDRDDENFRGDPIDPEELFESLGRTETFTDEDGQVISVDIAFNPAEVMRFRIMEEWFIDTRRSTLDVRIIGLSPAREAIDFETGEFLGWESLFWIPFSEIRELLASSPVYNRQNSVQRISFDDYFLRRLFDATIYREERPDNLVISEYIEDPNEQLLEAQRIKERIRNMELDLWHY